MPRLGAVCEALKSAAPSAGRDSMCKSEKSGGREKSGVTLIEYAAYRDPQETETDSVDSRL